MASLRRHSSWAVREMYFSLPSLNFSTSSRDSVWTRRVPIIKWKWTTRDRSRGQRDYLSVVELFVRNYNSIRECHSVREPRDTEVFVPYLWITTPRYGPLASRATVFQRFSLVQSTPTKSHLRSYSHNFNPFHDRDAIFKRNFVHKSNTIFYI